MKRILIFLVFLNIVGQAESQIQQPVELTIQSGHFDNIKCLDFSKDGKWLASGGDDGMLKVWDITSGRLLATFIQKGAAIISLSFSPSSEYVASLTTSGQVTIWNISRSEIKFNKTIPAATQVLYTGKLEYGSSDNELYALFDQQLFKIENSSKRISNMAESAKIIDFDYVQEKENIRYLLAEGGIVDGSNNNRVENTYALNKVDKRLIKNGSIKVQALVNKETNMVAVIKGWKIELVDPSGPVRHNTIQGDYMDDHFSGMVFINSKKLLLAVNTDSRIYAIDLTRKNKFKRLTQAHVDDAFTIASNQDESLFATAGADRSIIIWDATTLKPVRTLFGKTFRMESVSFVPDHGKVAFGDELGYLKIVDLFDRNLTMKSDKVHKYAISHVEYFQNKYISTAQDNYLRISDLDLTMREETKVMHKFTPSYFFLNTFGFYKPYIYKVSSLTIDDTSASSAATQIGDYNFRWLDLKKVKKKNYSYTPKPIINAFDMGKTSLKPVPSFIQNHPHTHTNLITDYDQDEERNLGITSSWDCSLKIWDLNREELVATVVPFGTKTSRAIITPENYYMIDKKAFEGLNFKVGKKVFSAEQFDLKFNRPDKVLAKLGGFPEELVSAYLKAYQKRIKKMGFTEASLDSTFHAPEIDVDFPDNAFTSNQSTFTFTLKAYDSLYTLDRLNIWVNGVPEFGTQGKSLKKEDALSYKGSSSVMLSNGKNNIEISVLNSKGVESFKEKIQVSYLPQATLKPDLHLVCIGVSEYQNTNFNLNYAAKDSQDLVNFFKNSRQEYFGNVIVHTLNNDAATTQNIKDLKAKLSNTKINDHVYVFFSGHGVLNKDLDYFLATYDLNFSNPSQNGLLYEDFESILDGIPARQKLLMVDACHSGEIDKEEVQVLEESKPTDFQEVKMTRSGDQSITSKTIGLENSFELMKQQFVDLRKSTGATVISAAGGVEFAYEGIDGLRNGVFTHAVIEGLKEKKADLNGDGIIYLSELQAYVAQEVLTLTNGKQQPTSRIENLINDFRIR